MVGRDVRMDQDSPKHFCVCVRWGGGGGGGEEEGEGRGSVIIHGWRSLNNVDLL